LLQDFATALLEDAEHGHLIVEAHMNAQPETEVQASIEGHVIDRGSAHSIAMYERDGVSWVAEFRGGRGELMNANTWFYFHSERLGYWHRRRACKSVQPLPLWMLVEIERLHRDREAREAATAARRCKVTLAEAAARLHRAVERVAEADDASRPEQATPSNVAAAVRRLNPLLAGMRNFVSSMIRTTG
jgi:hypothetical protein